MSATALHRNPTRLGLAPSPPRCVEPAPDIEQRLLRTLGSAGRLTGLVFEHEAPTHFRFDPADGRSALFLKLVGDDDRAAHLTDVERIVSWLAASGQPVAPTLEGFPRRVDRLGCLFAYRMIAGRYARAEENDLACIASALAALHEALAAHPDVPRWRQATERRLADLETIRAEIVEGRCSVGPAPDALRSLARDPALSFGTGRPDACPLHGDLNPGNLLMTEPPQSVWFLDFEDTPHSVLPPIFELAYAVERFVSAEVDDEARAITLGRCFLEAYRARGGAEIRPGDSLVDATRSLALRSLCVLAQSETGGVSITTGEWHKFLTLAERAHTHAAALDAIWAP